MHQHGLMRTARFVATRGMIVLGILVFGVLMGAASAILPPSMILIPLLPLLLMAGLVLWAMPSLRRVPYGAFRVSFFVLVAALTSIAPYVAIDPPGLPWISVVRVAMGVSIILFLLCISGSTEQVRALRDIQRGGRPISTFVIVLLLTYLFAIPLAHAVGTAASGLADRFTYWYLPFAMTLLAIRDDRDVRRLLLLLAGTAIFLLGIALWEYRIERSVYLYVTHSSMFSGNPIMDLVAQGKYRHGDYRVRGPFMVSLSFAEYLAIIAPLCLYIAATARSLGGKAFGAIAYLAAVVTILLTGTRGGPICLVIGTGSLIFFYMVSLLRRRGSGILGPLLASLYVSGAAVFVLLVVFSRRLWILFFGSGEAAASTDSRRIQWEMAWPRILENPLTGHGAGSSGEVVGFVAPNGTVTVDSYLITILVDVGFPGFIAFFGMIILAAWFGVRLYLKAPTRETGALMAIASSLIGYGVYRTVLSQTENHTILFILVGVITGALYRARQEAKDRAAAAAPNPDITPPRSRPPRPALSAPSLPRRAP